MFIRRREDDATAGRTLKKSKRHEIRLENVFNYSLFFRKCGGERVYSNGAAVKFLRNDFEESPIVRLKAKRIDFQHLERFFRNVFVYRRLAFNLTVVAGAAKQAISDAWRPPSRFRQHFDRFRRNRRS